MLPPPQMMIAVALPAFSHAERERWSAKRGPSRLHDDAGRREQKCSCANDGRKPTFSPATCSGKHRIYSFTAPIAEQSLKRLDHFALNDRAVKYQCRNRNDDNDEWAKREDRIICECSTHPRTLVSRPLLSGSLDRWP